MSNKSTGPTSSIIVPAYNEENCIGPTLDALTREMIPGEFDIIVVCNGCQDNTANIAQDTCKQVRVVETSVASKTNALNIGLHEAKCRTVVFLDADIQTSAASVRLLLNSLITTKQKLAYGKALFNTDSCLPAVQAFYKAWRMNPYFDGGKVGGFFAVSDAGLNTLGTFPDLINDDEFVRRKLMANSIYVPEAKYTVQPPRTLSSLIRVRSRIYRGNKQLVSLKVPLAGNQQHSNSLRFIQRLARDPSAWLGAMIFAAVAVAAHLRNRTFDTNHWEQDPTARAVEG